MKPKADAPTPEDLKPREYRVVALLLLLVLAVAFHDVFFFKKSIVYSDNYNPVRSVFDAESYGPDVEPTTTWDVRNLAPWANVHDADAGFYQWEPTGEFLRQSIHSLEAPLWDPFLAAGTPAMTNYTPTFFFPPYFVMVVLGNTSLLKNVYFLGMLYFAGFFMHVLLRRHGLSRTASFLGAVTFMLSGTLVQNVGSFIAQSVNCLPLVLLLCLRVIERPLWRRACVLSLATAGVLFASHLPVLVPALTIAFLYATAGVWGPWSLPMPASQKRSARIRLAAALGLAVGLVAFYYLPSLALVLDAPHVRAAYLDAALEQGFPVRLALQWISPTLMGGRKVYNDPPGDAADYHELPYIGMLPLLLIGLCGGGQHPRSRLLFRTSIVALVLGVGILHGVPPFRWLGRLPGLNSLHLVAYVPMVLVFPLSVLAAFGLDRMRELSRRRCVTVGALAVGALLALLYFAHYSPDHPDLAESAHYETWLGTWIFTGSLTAVLIALVLYRSWTGAKPSATSAAVVVLVLLESVFNTTWPRRNRWDVWHHPPAYVETIKRSLTAGRVFGIDALEANASSAFGIRAIDSLQMFNPPRIFEWYKRYINPTASTFMREAKAFPPEEVLDSASVELVLVRKEGSFSPEPRARGYQEIYDDGYVVIFRRPSPPLCYFTTRYTVVQPGAALDAIAARDGAVILETQPSFAKSPSSPVKVEVLNLRRNGYRLSLDAPTRGLLYCADSFFPGWSAKVNGSPTKILPANYAFRAVEVDAGPTVVELDYWPRGLTLGLALSGAALLLLIVLATIGDRSLLTAPATT